MCGHKLFVYLIPNSVIAELYVDKELCMYAWFFNVILIFLTLLQSERPKLYAILAFMSAKGLNCITQTDE